MNADEKQRHNGIRRCTQINADESMPLHDFEQGAKSKPSGSRVTAPRDDNNSTTSIMIPSLEEIDAFIADGIDNAMFACQTARPSIAVKVFEWFWFANPFERISQNSFHKCQNAKGYLAICLNPIVQVCTKFWMKNSIAHYYYSPTSRRKSSMDCAGSVPALARFSAVASRSAFLGDLRR